MAQQNLDFNIVAHTKGMEAIATLINRVGALEAETKRLASANQTLSASTDAVVRNGVRYNNAMDAQSRQLRQNRQGTQQLGMQINDFATSVSTGASVTQAFSQQIGQVGYAMSQMGGVAGRIGSFLAGPWGAAVLVGAMALGPIIDKLFQSKKAAEEAANAHYKYLDAVRMGQRAELMKGEADLKAKTEERIKLQTTLEKISKGPRSQELYTGKIVIPGMRKRLDQLNQEIAFLNDAVNTGTAKLYELETPKLTTPKVSGGRSVGGRGDSAAGNAIEEAEKAKKRLDEIKQHLDRIRYQDDQDRAKSFTEMGNDQQSKLQQTIANIQEMATAGVETLDQKFIKPFRDSMDELTKSYESIGNAVASSFQGMLSGAMSWKEGMSGIINSVINELWRLYVVQQIVGFVTNTLGGLGLPLPKPKAVGGYVESKTPYMVGEKGPELFIPGGSGTIIPNKNVNMGNGGGSVTVNVDARGSADPAAVRAQVQKGILEAAPAIIAAAEARTVQGLRRPRLGGAMK